MRRILATLLFITCAEAQSDRYAGAIYKAITTGNLQSVSAAVIVDGRIQHLVVKGYANRWAGLRATPDTVYPFGAITGTFTATSLVQAASEKRVGLDDPIEKYLLGIRVRGQEPTAPITIRHVLTHASGIVDSREPLDMHRGVIPALPGLLLFSNILFTARPPLIEVRYSAVAYGALGLLLSSMTGQTVPDYFRETWTEPLGMPSTTYYRDGGLQERLAVGYTRPEQGDASPLQRSYHSPTSPLLGAEGLLGTAADLARWLLFHLNCGKSGDRQWMQPSVFNDMHRVQFPELRGRRFVPQSLFDSDHAGWGLGWMTWPCDGDRCIAHTGSTPGYTAVLAGNLDRKTGVAILVNSDSAEHQIVQLAIELVRIATTEASSRMVGLL